MVEGGWYVEGLGNKGREGERAEKKETEREREREKRDLIIIDKLEKALNTRNLPRARIGA